ncbi:hypothetical protein [Brevundimonas sp.]|uniref:hypothetical protein n=1 Tax=Brevundimonas sp. TaxID=1871086 RepID=UPI002897CB7C|nr:hypothetical protein [Brevundimonas sp.]
MKVLAIAGVVVIATLFATYKLAISPQMTGPSWGWISAAGFSLTVLGVVVSLAGFAITLEQIQITNDEVAETQREAEALRKSLVIYSAAQDASLASYAIKSAKRHYLSSALQDFVESYDDFRRSIVAIGKNVEGIPVDVTDGIDQADKYISRLCKRIEAGSNVNQAKVLSEIRSHQDLSANIIAILQKVSIK